MNEEAKLSAAPLRNGIEAVIAGSIAGCMFGIVLAFVIAWASAPARARAPELGPGSFSIALAALRDGAVVYRESDRWNKYRMKNGVIVCFNSDYPEITRNAIMFDEEEVLADDWIVESTKYCSPECCRCCVNKENER